MYQYDTFPPTTPTDPQTLKAKSMMAATTVSDKGFIDSSAFTHGGRNLRQLGQVYANNKSSGYTERIAELGEGFDYQENSTDYWLKPEFSILYGSPLYTEASEVQRQVLNHLYWICFYNYSIGGEITTMMFNQLACGAFYHLGGYESLCHELDLETFQERVHVEAFVKVSQGTERALFGDLVFSRELPSFLDAALIHPQKDKRNWLAKLPLMFNSIMVSSSPFLAANYFVLRGVRNIQLKVKEYQHLLHAKESEKAGKKAAIPCQISYYHCLDEAFHTTTSKLISHDIYRDFPKPSILETKMSNIGVARVQRTMKTLSSAVPGIFSDDERYMPLVYRLLQTPVFGMSPQEAVTMLKKCFCELHEGFYISQKYHQRALTQNKEYVADLEYLCQENRELSIMAQASPEKSLKDNLAAFARFRQKLDKEQAKIEL